MFLETPNLENFAIFLELENVTIVTENRWVLEIKSNNW